MRSTLPAKTLNFNMEAHANALNWFEIPAADMERARTFYSAILGEPMGEVEDAGRLKKSYFPTGSTMDNIVGGALAHSPYHTPSMQGSVIYLNANPSIQAILDRVDAAGGKVMLPRTDIGNDIGFMASFADTEGNMVSLHARN